MYVANFLLGMLGMLGLVPDSSLCRLFVCFGLRYLI